eukprot:scpid95055/ scgid30061/ 
MVPPATTTAWHCCTIGMNCEQGLSSRYFKLAALGRSVRVISILPLTSAFVIALKKSTTNCRGDVAPAGTGSKLAAVLLTVVTVLLDSVSTQYIHSHTATQSNNTGNNSAGHRGLKAHYFFVSRAFYSAKGSGKLLQW